MTQTLHALLNSVGLPVPAGVANATVTALTCDSRCVGKGSLFIGLPGERVDGGSFWPAALASGAAAVLIGERAAAAHPPGPGDSVLVVPDPVAFWAGELASAFWQRPSMRMELIGVTGTNGKTTTTHLIEHLSQACGRPAALFGTLVNRWPGHSLTATHTTAAADRLQAQLAEALEGGTQVAAMEVSSHALDQQRVAGCRFSGAVFTNLTQDHLDYHPSMEAYFEAKALLFASPYLVGEGPRAVVNVDDPWGRQLADRLGERAWRCSLEHEADLTMGDLRMTSNGVDGMLVTPLGEGRFHSPLVGRFNLMNLLQAVGALLQQGLPLALLLRSLPSFRGVPGRMERVVVTGSAAEDHPAVLVDYAHTPDGLRNALEACRPFVRGQLICVFGCGGDRDRGKRPQMAAIAAELADRVVVTSDNPRTEDPGQILEDVVEGLPAVAERQVEVDRAKAIALAIAQARCGDLVLIAGKGHEDYQILGTQKVHFDDREEAEQALRQWR
ncbi:MAG: UDP-N-acetylmuramoyl-L-alanyl-D-glutamate--2,6-diaminopimelate ligase [Synechococcus sp. BS307-5m-G39]|nr:UDP-N-acetylmuramoyl-L-alanyl-D-glutamate--2,6-diaminopimelate ligase [Synechococcus sp. BS307-5m-G39]